MRTIEEGMVDARNQTLEGSSPGNQALAALQAETATADLKIKTGEADAAWRKRPVDPAQAAWGKKDYRYVDAYCAGTNLETGELPNRYFTPNAVNVAGFDLATGNKMKSVVDNAYEGNAAYGVGQLTRSHTNIMGVRPPTDIIGLSAVAAAMQAKGLSYEDYERGLPGWDPSQLKHSWAAGTDSLRHAPVEHRLTNNLMTWTNYAPVISVHPAQPTSLDFDVRMGDKEFQKAGRTIYQHFNGAPFQDTDAAAARWLASHMRDLDWNTPMAAAIMLKGKNATWDAQNAYITAIEAWGQTNMERRLLPQIGNAARAFLDPMNIWGTPIGKLTVNTAARFAALDFFKRMVQSGAMSGATGAVVQEVVQANLQAKDPTVGGMALAAAGGAALGEGGPLLLQAGGKAIKRGVNALKRPDMPDIPPNNVLPRPTGEGTYIPAAEAPKPAEAAARPVQGDPTMAELEAGNLTTAEGRPINLEQQPWEGPPGFADQEAAQGFPNPPADQVEAASQQAGARGRDALTDPAAGEQAAAALPVETARPAPPRDPTSRLFIDPSTGYYSPIQKAVAEATQSKQTPEQWLGINGPIRKAPFFKQDELEWLELDKFFKGKDSVTKEELLAHIDENLVKIQRHPLVAQRRNTVSWEEAVARNNPEYAALRAERQAVDNEMAEIAGAHYTGTAHVERLSSDLEEIVRKTLDIGPDDPRYDGLQADLAERRAEIAKAKLDTTALGEIGEQVARAHQLDQHMARVAAEERKALIASGEPAPPWVHGIEHMLTEFDTGTEIETRETLDKIFKHLQYESEAQAKLAAARTDATRAKYAAEAESYQAIIKDLWQDLEGMAANVGAIIHPSDLERVNGMINYGDPQVRDYSILGAGMRGTRYTQGGIDPIGHQIALYRHPEGLQASGATGHPGGDPPGTLGWAITSERNLSNGETITLADEVQADLAKERRRGEREYVKMKQAVDADTGLDFDGAAALRKSEDYDDYVWQTYLDTLRGRPGARTLMPKLPEHWRDATPKQRDAMLTTKDVWGIDNTGGAEDVPAMPKQIFYATAQSNILKSELYNAALNGKDNFGWAPASVIQDRYGARPLQVQGDIRVSIAGRDQDGISIDGYITTGREGTPRISSKLYPLDKARELAERMPGDAGAALRKFVQAASDNFNEVNTVLAPLDELTLHLPEPFRLTPGAYWPYDVQMVKEMRKFVEKWGGKVTQEDMPVAPGSEDTVKVWTIKITGPLRKKLLEQGVPIGAAAGAAVTAGQEEEAMQ